MWGKILNPYYGTTAQSSAAKIRAKNSTIVALILKFIELHGIPWRQLKIAVDCSFRKPPIKWASHWRQLTWFCLLQLLQIFVTNSKKVSLPKSIRMDNFPVFRKRLNSADLH